MANNRGKSPINISTTETARENFRVLAVRLTQKTGERVTISQAAEIAAREYRAIVELELGMKPDPPIKTSHNPITCPHNLRPFYRDGNEFRCSDCHCVMMITPEEKP